MVKNNVLAPSLEHITWAVRIHSQCFAMASGWVDEHRLSELRLPGFSNPSLDRVCTSSPAFQIGLYSHVYKMMM